MRIAVIALILTFKPSAGHNSRAFISDDVVSDKVITVIAIATVTSSNLASIHKY